MGLFTSIGGPLAAGVTVIGGLASWWFFTWGLELQAPYLNLINGMLGGLSRYRGVDPAVFTLTIALRTLCLIIPCLCWSERALPGRRMLANIACVRAC